MAKTITIDKVELERLLVLKDGNGDVHVMTQYTLKAGAQAEQAKHDQIEGKLTGARRAAIAQLFNAVAQDLSSIELG